jgi:hypothetical protein
LVGAGTAAASLTMTGPDAAKAEVDRAIAAIRAEI